ncbi:MAG: sel1 repeat family protein [Bacteroidaceae bacterium]|nr:sel1 repeat family protein [Bacteroidaceae bacterium]
MESYKEGLEKDNAQLYFILNKGPVIKDCSSNTDFFDKSLQLLNYRESVLDGTDEEDNSMSHARELVDMYIGAIMGDPIFQAVIGSLFYEGKRVDIDYKEAFYWCLKAAEYGTGMDEQQYYVGRMYELGQGVKRDNIKAIEWYLKASSQENILATARLSELFLKESKIWKGQNLINSAIESS